MSIDTSLVNSMANAKIRDPSGDGPASFDRTPLVEALVKLCIIDYRTEPRFVQPVARSHASSTALSPSQNLSPTPSASSSTRTHHRQASSSRFTKFLHSSSSSDFKLSNETVTKLKQKLNRILMTKNDQYDDLTRRSLLRYYGELLEPTSKDRGIKNPEQLVVRFVACATKELNKIGTVPSEQISNVIYDQAETFISILIDTIKPEKHSDIMISKLEELKKSMKPTNYTKYQRPLPSSSGSSPQRQDTYLTPSFNISDITMVQFLGKIFQVDAKTLQKLVNDWKDTCTESTLIDQLTRILQEYQAQSDSISFQLEDFDKTTNYLSWKAKEEKLLALLTEKYQTPSTKQQKSHIQKCSIIPSDVFKYFVETVKACIKYDSENTGVMLSKTSQELLDLCCRVWRIDAFSKVTLIYTAIVEIHQAQEQQGLDIDLFLDFFSFYTSYRLDQSLWPRQIKQKWVDSLTATYVFVMKEIRDNLTRIYNEMKPKFGPILELLLQVESDPLFSEIQDSGITKKWENKLNKSLLKVSETRYVELLGQIPRDNSLDLGHIVMVGTKVIDDAKLLSKRYPNPLLGVLYVPQLCAGLSTAMFALDSKNMLLHIKSYSDNTINYGDAMEVYKLLSEIRSIFQQVSAPGKQFKFDLEQFFYPDVDEWCEESGEKMLQFVAEAVKKDTFQPVNVENDQLYSSSIVDIFSMVNQSILVLKDLGWANQYQYLKLVTKLLRFISLELIKYSNIMMDIMLDDLDEQTDDITEDQGLLNNTTDWLKNAVSGSSTRLEPPKPFDFKPKTCVALNNLELMLKNLLKLEELVDPESISSIIRSKESKVRPISHLFSIRIIQAENLKKTSNNNRLPDTYVSLMDGQNKRRILKTRIVKNSLNPDWDEEFEIVVPQGSSAILGATVWDCASRLGNGNVSGRTAINLQPSKFNMDGLPQDLELELDTQGKLLIQISMESEREDAIFCMGRAHRSISRVQERCVKLIVEKFLTFVEFSISRETLKLVCGKNGNVKPSVQVARSLLEPLFDYLNVNFQVLASNLTDSLLLQVILQTWIVVLNVADNLLLPKLSSLKQSITINALKSHSKRNSTATWQNVVSNAVGAGTMSGTVSGFGKPLTQLEVDVVFEWLKVLCFEFFHNNGAGPPIGELKNEKYQELLLVPVYYDHSIRSLEEEVDRFSPATLRVIREKHYYSIGADSTKSQSSTTGKKLTRAGTMARRKTILASGSARQRALAAQEYQQARSDPILAQLALENIVLRLLLLKGAKEFVSLRLEQRERLSKSIAAEFFARFAAEGTL